MALKVTRVDVWAGEIQDQPGGLSRVLGAVAGAGGSLECVIARREPTRPGTGVVFVTPVKGARVQEAARGAGLSPAENIATLRVEGTDAPGVGSRITEALSGASINLRGVSTAVIGRNFVSYIGLDNPADAETAMAALKQVKSRATTGGTSRGAAKGAARGAKRAQKTTTKRATGRRR